MTQSSSPKLAWWRAGDEGPDVLLIMGFGMQGKVWAPQTQDLSRDHRVLYFDNRGIGQSERGPRRTWTMRDMAADACRVLDEAGVARAHIVGVSLGGMIAQHLALNHPERVDTLSLIATSPGGGIHRVFPGTDGLKLFLRANGNKGDGRIALLQQLLYPPEFLAECDVEAMAASMDLRFGQPAPLGARVGQVSAVLRHDARPHLSNIRMPTLIVRPGKDLLVDARGSDALAAGIPNAKVLRLEGAGHGAILQCAGEINVALREHFRGQFEARSVA